VVWQRMGCVGPSECRSTHTAEWKTIDRDPVNPLKPHPPEAAGSRCAFVIKQRHLRTAGSAGGCSACPIVECAFSTTFGCGSLLIGTERQTTNASPGE
jgi:hypothetical protein